jgi:hypothetical protein
MRAPTCSRLARRHAMPTIDTTADSSVRPTVAAHLRAHFTSDLFVLSYCARFIPLLFITWYVNSWYADVLKNNVTPSYELHGSLVHYKFYDKTPEVRDIEYS